MKQQTIGKAVIGFLGLAVLVSLGTSKGQDHASGEEDHGTAGHQEEHGEHPAEREYGPHERAPHDIVLEVEHGEWLRAPGDDWFTSQPERFGERGEVEGRPAYEDANTGDLYVNRHDDVEDADAWYMRVSRDRLTRGRIDFVQYCASCHGFDGQGYGRSAQGLRPPPRDFTSGNFKFSKILVDLPTDEALVELIEKGLDGTPMLKWDIPRPMLMDIIQYIKSLSPPESAWRDVYSEIGDKVNMGEDPWESDPARGIKRGEKVYHNKGTCYACHPAYASQEKIREFRGDDDSINYRANLTYSELKESDYMVLGKQIFFFPPDFTWHQLRSGTSKRELAETIASGIKGTAMPQWKNAIPDEDIWAIAYYVHNLITEYKGQPSKRAAFFAPLRAE